MKNIVDRKLILKWIRALRSGKYRQTTGQLRTNGSHTFKAITRKGTGYCCLGVLCEIGGYKCGNGTLLPRHLCVKGRTGVPQSDPCLGVHYATTWNDVKNASFRKIATLIEKHVLPNYPQKKARR